MKKVLFLLFTTITILSCSGVKKTQEAISYGNYDEAIQNAVKQLRSNKTKKSNQPYVFMLEESFVKAASRDIDKISFLEKDENPANLESIYNLYMALNNRQEIIKPLLPLPILSKGKNAVFKFNDYSNNIINSKNKLSNYLYTNAKRNLATATHKMDFRSIYNDLKYLDDINPNYKDTRVLLEETHFKGTDFVIVTLLNKTDKIIPQRLEDDLLNFDTYKLNDFWTVYHNNEQSQIKYNYELQLDFREINISPEQISEKEIQKEKQVKDGWKYLQDDKGNAVKDSLGNNIKVDKFKTIRCTLYENIQLKSAQVVGQVKYFDLRSNQLIQAFPIASEFVFEHHYATYSGDRNALEADYSRLLNYKFIPFPSNEQMIYDSGEDLKNKIKSIITQNKFSY